MRSLPLVVLLSACAGAPAEPSPAAPSVPAAAAVDYRIVDGRVEVPDAVTFVTGAAALSTASDAALWHVVGFLVAKPSITTLRIEVHGDGVGDRAAEQALGEARAAAVFARLVELGADPKRLLAVAFGDEKPVAAADTPEGQAQNRRVEFRPAAMRGKAIGGMPLDGGGRVVAPK
ncbi:MAG: OmpA family protein [Planctomycetes bacterium]|nr:OmpA family protein [Planctomycetota bacterium]